MNSLHLSLCLSQVLPITISSSTTKVDTRARSRQASLKIESNDMDGNWRFGLFRFDSQPDGMR